VWATAVLAVYSGIILPSDSYGSIIDIDQLSHSMVSPSVNHILSEQLLIYPLFLGQDPSCSGHH
jgi:hypothetical protein